MQERRKCTRSRVLKSAKLVLRNSSVIDCVVRNVTGGGARIEIPHTTGLPEAVGLTLDGGRTIRRCRLAWRTLTETGVEFL